LTTTPDQVAYCTREQVQAILDQSNATRLNRAIDDACQAGARQLEGVLHRRFYPILGTRYPDPRWVSGDTLWLNHMDHEIQALTSLTVDGTALAEGTDFYLDLPGGDGPPYTAIRLYRDTAQAWPTDPRDIVSVGSFGGSSTVDAAGILAASITTAGAVSMTVTDSSLLGVGDMALIDSEQVIVTEKSSATTTATLSGSVAADESVTTVPVSSGALVQRGEMILVGSERMFVEDVAGNNLIVQRAQHASVLAAHSASDVVYAPRLCTITRGAAGTTAVSHLTAAEVWRNRPPSLVNIANTALAINYLEQGKAGYSRTAGVGDNRRESGGTGVAAAVAASVEAARQAFGRAGRIGVC
jgi:hypothetical protein